MRVTYAMLVRRNACTGQRQAFAEVVGERRSVEVSVELCVKHAHTFNWRWAACYLLPIDLADAWRTLERSPRRRYEKITSAARQVRNDAWTAADRYYNRHVANRHVANKNGHPADVSSKVYGRYNARIEAIRVTYDGATDKAFKSLCVSQARLFGKLAVQYDNSRKAAKKARTQ